LLGFQRIGSELFVAKDRRDFGGEGCGLLGLAGERSILRKGSGHLDADDEGVAGLRPDAVGEGAIDGDETFIVESFQKRSSTPTIWILLTRRPPSRLAAVPSI
jgi:hypothetical protein